MIVAQSLDVIPRRPEEPDPESNKQPFGLMDFGLALRAPRNGSYSHAGLITRTGLPSTNPRMLSTMSRKKIR